VFSKTWLGGRRKRGGYIGSVQSAGKIKKPLLFRTRKRLETRARDKWADTSWSSSGFQRENEGKNVGERSARGQKSGARLMAAGCGLETDRANRASRGKDGAEHGENSKRGIE